ATAARLLGLAQQEAVDIRAFPNRTSHGLSLLRSLARVTAARDEFRCPLVLAGLHTLGRLAPRAHRMAAARGAAFAAAERMVDGVLGDARPAGLLAEPAVAARLADVDVAVVRVGHRADRREAALVYQPLLPRIEAKDGVALVAPDILRVGPGRARDL